MYYLVAWGLTLVIPALSVAIGALWSPDPDFVWLIAKWFVFWGIGVRLLMAGVRQTLKPEFTAQEIFRIKDPEAGKLVVEIGFGNIAMGAVATLSLLLPSLTATAGLTGGIFMAIAGLQHVRNPDRTAHENTALMTDLIVAIIVLVSAVLLLYR